MPENQPSATNDASISTRLALQRTHQANERTLMAWIRTATSLIAFGFTIYKFFQFQIEKGVAPSGRLLGPREYGMLMISIGIIALILATMQHAIDTSRMKKEYGKSAFSVSLVVAILSSALGAFALVAAIFRQ